MNSHHYHKFKHHVLQTYQCIVLHENIKNYQNACFPDDSRYKVIKNCLSNMLIVEKRCPVAILFVNISLATVTSSMVTSSKLNVENSAKAWYVNKTYSYRSLKFEINKSNQRIL